jgi:hypothetical protein
MACAPVHPANDAFEVASQNPTNLQRLSGSKESFGAAEPFGAKELFDAPEPSAATEPIEPSFQLASAAVPVNSAGEATVFTKTYTFKNSVWTKRFKVCGEPNRIRVRIAEGPRHRGFMISLYWGGEYNHPQGTEWVEDDGAEKNFSWTVKVPHVHYLFFLHTFNDGTNRKVKAKITVLLEPPNGSCSR